MVPKRFSKTDVERFKWLQFYDFPIHLKTAGADVMLLSICLRSIFYRFTVSQNMFLSIESPKEMT